MYDLFNVVFAGSAVMLKEHFRCVGPIIEYSKREFYNHELRPLRVPRASERLDPPLVDVVVQDGYRHGDVNLPEARFIVDEIKAIVADPDMAERSIGVVSLLADKQALAIWERLTDEIGPELMQRHRIACGDARTFQGKERDIMFLSMVSAPNQVGGTLSGLMYDQRFNVAASRARDRMYLVRSVDLEHLSHADLRRGLIEHFYAPFAKDEMRVEDLRKLCESGFEREVYDELTQRGYCVTPQVQAGPYRIDMVVEGHNDARLAVECDGDKYHGPDKWADDVRRERNLMRAGWGVFWRCFASAFIRRRKEVLGDLLRTLAERGIEPIGAEGAPRSVHTEHRVVSSVSKSPNQAEVWPVEGPVSLEAPKPDVPPISSTSAGKVLPQPGEPRRFDSEDVRTEDAANRPEFDDGDTSEIPTTTPGTDQIDALNTVKSLPGIEANECHQSTTQVKERTPMEFVLKKEKETPGTWRYKEDKDERPLTIYLAKDQVNELGNPTSIIVTIKAA
jgi:very-short-patch-repair endonuclease